MHLNYISRKQGEIFSFVKRFIQKNRNNIDVANSSVCYFHNYGDYVSSSYLRIKFHGLKFLGKFMYNFFKNLYSVINVENYFCPRDYKKDKYDHFFISHVSKKDFLKDGSYIDEYFQIKSNENRKILFFLVSSDDYLPIKNQKNIIILKKKKNEQSLIILIKKFFFFLFQNKFSLKKLFHEFNFQSQFSLKILPLLKQIILKNDFKKIIFFYEAQPYQNKLIKELRKMNVKAKTLGFYHSGLLPVHTSLVFRDGAPDRLLISGKFQKKYCEKYLGWPKSRVSDVPSFRYSKKNLLSDNGTIYLPYEISKPNIILDSLNVYLKKSKKKSLPLFKIKNHPAKLKSNKHRSLIIDINKILKKNSIKFNNKINNTSIFIGSTTALILALEQKKEVIHICEDPIFDSFSGKIWNNLLVSKIDNFVFKYKLKQNKHILNLINYNRNNFKTFLK